MDDLDILEIGDPQEVTPPKVDFRDQRMNNAACPLCQSELRLVRAEEHSFGEFGFWQCQECGAILDCCNMVDQPIEYHLFSRMVSDEWSGTLRSIAKVHGYFPKMPFEKSRTAIKNDRENEKLDKLEAQVRCASCNERFNPAPSAKSILTLDYCAPCRKKPEIREEVARREADAKAAAKKASKASKKKVTSTRRKK